MTAYYNENDPKKAAWLRELINRDLIAPGEVDERSIEDVKPSELLGYTQCHFFAGVGIWSYALRLAGWPDDRAAWTGSCPCQPFSVAGKSAGFADERHLWPSWFWLIKERAPRVVFGEQVASKDGYSWLDLVQSDMEGLDYAFGPVVLPAAGFGAPHGRHRIFFVAESEYFERWPQQQAEGTRSGGPGLGRSCVASTVADSADIRRAQHERESGERRTKGPEHTAERSGAISGLGDAFIPRLEGHAGDGDGISKPGRIETDEARPVTAASVPIDRLADATEPRRADQREHDGGSSPLPARSEQRGPANGFWRDAAWLYCKDEKYRPAKPGTFPLAHGAPARVVRLRGYGDGIVAEVAKEFIQAYMSLSYRGVGN